MKLFRTTIHAGAEVPKLETARCILWAAFLVYFLSGFPTAAESPSELKEKFDTYIEYTDLDRASKLLKDNKNIFDDFADRAIVLGECLAQNNRWEDAAELYREALRYPSLQMDEADKRILIRDHLFGTCTGSGDGEICKDWHTRFQKQAVPQQIEELKKIITRDYQPYLDDPLGEEFPTGWADLASAVQPDLVHQARSKSDAVEHFRVAKRDHLRTRPKTVRNALEQVKPKIGTRGYTIYEQELSEINFFDLFRRARYREQEREYTEALSAIAQAEQNTASRKYPNELADLQRLRTKIQCIEIISDTFEDAYEYLTNGQYSSSKARFVQLLSDSSCSSYLTDQQRTNAKYFRAWSQAQVKASNSRHPIATRSAEFLRLLTLDIKSPPGYHPITDGYLPLMQKLYTDVMEKAQDCGPLEELATTIDRDYSRTDRARVSAEIDEYWKRISFEINLNLATCWADRCRVESARSILDKWSSRMAFYPESRPHLAKVDKQLGDCLSRQSGAVEEGSGGTDTEQGSGETPQATPPRSSPGTGDGLPDACKTLPTGKTISSEVEQAFGMLNDEFDFDSGHIEKVLTDLKEISQACRSELWIAFGDYRYRSSEEAADSSRKFYLLSNAIQSYHKTVNELEDNELLMHVCRRVIARICEVKKIMTGVAGYSNSEFRISIVIRKCAEINIKCGESNFVMQESSGRENFSLPWFAIFFDVFRARSSEGIPEDEIDKATGIIDTLRKNSDINIPVQDELRKQLDTLGIQSDAYQENLWHFIISIRAAEISNYTHASSAIDNITTTSLQDDDKSAIHEACNFFRIDNDVCKR